MKKDLDLKNYSNKTNLIIEIIKNYNTLYDKETFEFLLEKDNEILSVEFTLYDFLNTLNGVTDRFKNKSDANMILVDFNTKEEGSSIYDITYKSSISSNNNFLNNTKFIKCNLLNLMKIILLNKSNNDINFENIHKINDIIINEYKKNNLSEKEEFFYNSKNIFEITKENIEFIFFGNKFNNKNLSDNSKMLLTHYILRGNNNVLKDYLPIDFIKEYTKINVNNPDNKIFSNIFEIYLNQKRFMHKEKILDGIILNDDDIIKKCLEIISKKRFLQIIDFKSDNIKNITYERNFNSLEKIINLYTIEEWINEIITVEDKNAKEKIKNTNFGNFISSILEKVSIKYELDGLKFINRFNNYFNEEYISDKKKNEIIGLSVNRGLAHILHFFMNQFKIDPKKIQERVDRYEKTRFNNNNNDDEDGSKFKITWQKIQLDNFISETNTTEKKLNKVKL